MKGSSLGDVTRFKASLVCIGLGSLSVCLIPFASFDGAAMQRVLAYAIGIMFWSFTIIGYLLLVKINQSRKSLHDMRKTGKGSRPGFLRLFSCREAAIADAATFVLLAAAVFILINRMDASFLTMAILSLLILFMQLRSILNGRNYMYIKNISRRSGKNEV